MKRMMLAGTFIIAACVSGVAQQPAQQPATPPAAPSGPQPKSKPELDAVMALQSAQADPDATIKAAEDLLTKFKDTQFKEIALFMEAGAYMKKNDTDKAQIYAEQVLAVNPKNFQASLMIGEVLAKKTRENDLDKEEKLAKAEKILNDTIFNLKTAPKPNPQITDAQWEEARKQLIAESQDDLGLAALTRKKYDVAADNFKLAVDNDPQPAYQVQLASADQQAGKNDEAIAICDKLLADPQLHPQIKQVATNVKNDATKAKGNGPGKL
jgi:tetratricopeptide (TPR) repeat protein